MQCGVVSASPPLSTLGLLSSFTVGVGSYMEQKEMLEISEEENVFLPNEIIMNIFSFLDLEDLVHCTIVCKNWHTLSLQNDLWHQQFKKRKYVVFWIDDKHVHKEVKTLQWKEMAEFCYKMERLKQPGKVTSIPNGHNSVVAVTEDITNGTCVARYRGELKNGEKEGRGISEWSDGSKYEGHWSLGKRNGFGTYFWPDGRKFIGIHVSDKRACGKFVWPEGSTYEGDYKNSVRHGHGVFRWPNGDFYEGGWKEGGRFGRGKLHILSGEEKGVYLQEWTETTFDYAEKGPLNQREKRRRSETENSASEDERDTKKRK